MTLFTMAFNYDKDIHKICLESLLRYNPQAKVFTSFEDIRMLKGGEEFVNKFKHISFLHFSDVFRVWYILNFGGTWIDADCLHTRPFEYPLGSNNLFFMYEDHRRQGITQCLIHCAQPNNQFLKELYDRQCQLVADKGPAGLEYLDLGEWSINHIRQNNSELPEFLPHWEYSYLAWYSKERYLEQREWHQFQYDRGIYSPNACCWHLTNAAMGYVHTLKRNQILASNTFLGFLCNRALGVGFDSTRHQAILKRLPDPLANYDYLEIGVYEGGTASVIGQQRWNANIYCVDPWSNVSTTDYLRTGDFCAHASNSDQERNYQIFRNNTWFLEHVPRFHVIRDSSKNAAKKLNKKFDLIFIDGDHSESGVYEDITLWKDKVKPGGFLSGHDYDYPGLPGVKAAVDRYVNENKFELVIDGDWTWHIQM